MMDYYNIDTSAFTKPPIIMHMVQANSGIGSVSSAFSFETLGNQVVGSSWVIDSYQAHDVVVINDSSSRSFLVKSTHASPAFKVVSFPVSEKHNIDHLKERLEFVYCNDEAAAIDEAQSRVALRGVVDVVEDLVDEHDYSALDSLLSSVDPERLRAVTAAAFLRSSFAVKDKLVSWNGLYQVVYAHLSNTGQNPKRALRGLSSNRVQSFA